MNEPLIIPLFAIMMPLFLVPTIILLVQRQKRREWQHQQRLRALELGLPVTPQERPVGGGSVTAIGTGVPLAAVVAALITTSSVPHSHPDFLAIVSVVWGCAFLITAFALVTSLVLAFMLMRSSKAPTDYFAAMKPAYEPDAFDVVSSRG